MSVTFTERQRPVCRPSNNHYNNFILYATIQQTNFDLTSLKTQECTSLDSTEDATSKRYIIGQQLAYDLENNVIHATPTFAAITMSLVLSMPQYCADFKKYIILSLSKGEIKVYKAMIMILMLQISKTMFAKRLFIRRIPSVLCD